MNLNNLKFDLPGNWREVSRSGNDNQINIRICHLSPLSRVNPKSLQDQLISSDQRSAVAKIAVPTPSGVGGSFAGYFKGMQAFIASGLAPAYMDSAWLEDLRQKLTQAPGAEIPDESDIVANVAIVQYSDQPIARQSFKNYGAGPMGGFNMPIPGMPQGTTYIDLLESDAFKPHVSSEQLAKMKTMAAKIKEATPKLKGEMAKTGLKYRETKYLSYDAIFSEMPNPAPAPPSTPIKRKTGGMGGGYGNNVVTPLPKTAQPYVKTITACQAILVKNFVVTGSLLSLPFMLPSGDTPCYSLTKTKNKFETVEGIKSTYITPAVSNL
ncbi:hypothetical protein COY54_00850 [Candidatus Falkowbacteria bacterium CG_4_10_14_0_8_um_filter_41_36]|uniref:Uncharacterized protein n=1 Tax=Candidatus Falkowbacteria bacterium CG_4_10_14_0_8_um_filter_41_36 TaxID=1974556 RepID=A0A2M7RYM2_9BACT|nr:MAG: hypothetical protein COY54_00850 [Candidatus Falkowbacteria bacterium CG_4_10_14_0_8_um_filter_41_36]